MSETGGMPTEGDPGQPVTLPLDCLTRECISARRTLVVRRAELVDACRKLQSRKNIAKAFLATALAMLAAAAVLAIAAGVLIAMSNPVSAAIGGALLGAAIGLLAAAALFFALAFAVNRQAQEAQGVFDQARAAFISAVLSAMGDCPMDCLPGELISEPECD